jgi:DNA-binding response OmpR family regulator
MVRVLVIDDDTLFVMLMVHSLKKYGHEVDFAPDGLTGVKKFRGSDFDVVVCDIVMPEQEGVETIQQMRIARADVAIVAISGGLSIGHSNKMDILEIANKLGADVTLKKPFQMSALNEAVDCALEMRRDSRLAARA